MSPRYHTNQIHVVFDKYGAVSISPDTLYNRRLIASQQNVWKSSRSNQKIGALASNHVPSLIQNNTRIVSDPNLEKGEGGLLYLAEDCFYNIECSPEYVLSVHPDIYAQVIHEVNDANSIPCGFYFCCHGGDGAHSGISHDDYVDIRVAIALVTFLISVMVFFTYTIPVLGGYGTDFPMF